MRRSRGGFPLAFGVSSVIDLYCLNAVLGAGARGGAVWTCTVPGVKKVDWITGAGTLCIRKLLNGGTIIFVR